MIAAPSKLLGVGGALCDLEPPLFVTEAAAEETASLEVAGLFVCTFFFGFISLLFSLSVCHSVFSLSIIISF